VFWNNITMPVAPTRPKPAVNRPTVPPARNATCMAPFMSWALAAVAVRMLARVDSHMPRNPIEADASPPTRNARVRKPPDWAKFRPSPLPSSITLLDVRNTITASGTTMMPIVRNWRVM
jgi:hypothetical protein